MTNPALILRHLCFTGPEKPPARVAFQAGLNVICGASETGKSFLLETLEFMLGASGKLRDIPERVGYDHILLGAETSDHESFTIVRAVAGGGFRLYEGLHDAVPDTQATVLKPTHKADKADNLSFFLLEKIGLTGKRIREDKQNATRSLSFRDLRRLCIVEEGDIQKKGSPIETGQFIHKTVEYSIFKLLLTGVDDSAVVPASRDSAAMQSRSAKVEFIDEMIASVQAKLDESGETEQELLSQLERLAASLGRDQRGLRATEEQYQALLVRRNKLRQSFENGSERRGEIDELVARFDLLDQHYQSDLARLVAIREAGSLLAALSPQTCPLCGSSPEEQHRENNCDGNLEIVVAAADAESSKIARLRRELGETVRQLGLEARSFDRVLPRMNEEREKLEQEIQELRPGLAELRTGYTELVEERASVQNSLSIFAQLADLQTRRKELERGPEGEATSGQAATDLSSTTLDQFAQHVEKLLKAWNFPEADRVHFEETDHDLIIHGKRRGSRGKGLRAITHSAFTIGILEFCKAQNRQHPGFVVLDSPLLAYKEPEGEEDDLTGTDVQEKFYEYLSAWTDRQVIIIENVDPPEQIKARPTTTRFSRNPHQGRFGFFPTLPLEAPSAQTS